MKCTLQTVSLFSLSSALSSPHFANSITLRMSTKDQHAIVAGIETLLSSSKYSDLTLICADQEFKVHRAVICPQSPVISAACDGDFEVSMSYSAWLAFALI